MSTSSSKNIVLVSKEGDNVEIKEAAARLSPTLSKKIDDGLNVIPLPDISHNILSLVKKYCDKHVEAAPTFDYIYAKSVAQNLMWFDVDFVRVNKQTLFRLVAAANYLKIESMEDLTCKAVADMLKRCKTVEEKRELFGIKNDYTKEEEDDVYGENYWAFKEDAAVHDFEEYDQNDDEEDDDEEDDSDSEEDDDEEDDNDSEEDDDEEDDNDSEEDDDEEDNNDSEEDDDEEDDNDSEEDDDEEDNNDSEEDDDEEDDNDSEEDDDEDADL